MSKCIICGEEAVGKYEGYPTCSKPSCEYKVQEGLDYLEDKS